MSLIRGIDTDNYDGPVSIERYKNLYDNYGVRFCIVGCQVGADGANYTKLQITNSITAGLAVPYVYEFLYWNDNDIERIKRAAGFGYPVFIDCETTKTGWVSQQYVERIHQAKAVLVSEGRYGGVYSGAWWWPGTTGNCKDFSADKLWTAQYPYGNGKLPPSNYLPDFNTFLSYGGWSHPTVFQYADCCYDESGFDMDAADESILGEIMATERYDGELNQARALKAVMHNLMLTTVPRFQASNPNAVDLVRVTDGTILGTLQLDQLPEYDQPN